MVSRHIEQAECMRRQGERHLMDVKRSGTSSGRAVRCRSGNAGWGAGVFAQAKRAAKKKRIKNTINDVDAPSLDVINY